MTLEEALTLVKGDVVVHRATLPELMPMRVAEVWVNEKRSIVLVRLPSIGGASWLDATGYEWPPEGKTWCRTCIRWHTRREKREKHADLRDRASLSAVFRK